PSSAARCPTAQCYRPGGAGPEAGMGESAVPAWTHRNGAMSDRSDREPTITVVVEAYNLTGGQSLAALDRALGAVGALLAAREDCEALLVRSMATAPLDALLARHGAVRVVDVPGAGYDALKDAGALAARGRVVAYLDGDCVPMD